MKFNRGNYEAFVLDWLEGKLSGPDRDLFLEFLIENPDIYSEIKALSDVQLEPSIIQFPDKNILKKSSNLSKFGSDFEKLSIAYLEGDLESEKKQKFESLLSENPDKLIEFELFRKSRVKPDMNIIFNKKSKLKRLSVSQRRIRLISAVSAAAVIVIVLIFTRNTGLQNRKLITNADTNYTKSTKTEIINPQPANNQLIQSEKELYSNSEPNDKFISAGKQQDLLNDIPGPLREQVAIKPVSSVFALIENNNSVGLNNLKKIESKRPGNFDSYLTLGEFASSKILGSLFPGNESFKQAKISFWDLASTGFEELNQITNGGYSLNREIGASGKLKRISIETPLLGISIPLKNKQPQ
jgi:hypothetical protein